jgi:hypothetical protein
MSAMRVTIVARSTKAGTKAAPKKTVAKKASGGGIQW